jgi:DNA-binding CsgD family transcriptional regulator/tetratricopeptide (TPR) repeat protein
MLQRGLGMNFSTAVLLEREPALEALHAAVASARTQGGRTVLLRGEAGMGKTSLLRAWAEQAASPDVVFHWGGCEALFTPRPLGPVIDLAAQMPGPMGSSVRAAVREHKTPGDVFTAFADWLSAGTFQRTARNGSTHLNVLVIEDAHWADHLTLDFLKYLGRRIHRWPAMLVLTYRDDEVDALHPLTQVLGELPSDQCTHVPLQALSESALAQLSGFDPQRLRALLSVSGGNPFFATEIIAADGANKDSADDHGAATVPNSVAAAVMARVQRISAQARQVLEVASLVPGSVELALINAMAPPSATAASSIMAGVDECVQRGLLQWRDRGLAFRHELARRALEDHLPQGKRQAQHAQVLTVLQQIAPMAVDRLAYHAARADNAAAVLDMAPRAAAQAAQLGAHREAAAHYRAALDVLARAPTPALPDQQRADLLQAWVRECQVLGRADDTVLAAMDEALALRRGVGDAVPLGDALREASALHRLLNQREAGENALAQAIATLESVPPSAELAAAYSHRSALHMLQNEWQLAEHWGDRAIALARALNQPQTVAHALNNIGSALMDDGQDRGYAMLMESLAIALKHGFRNDVARAYLNVSEACTRVRDLLRAKPLLQEGLAYVQKHDLDRHTAVLLSVQANVHQLQGRLPEAMQVAQQALANRALAAPLRNGPNTVCGTVALQTDLSVGRALLHDVWVDVLPNGQPDFIAPAAIGLAEGAWLAGDAAGCRDIVARAVAACHDLTTWDFGELACWYHRAGGDVRDLGARSMAPPCQAEIDGDLVQAAALWQAKQMPRHQAYVLMAMDPEQHPDAIRQAIELLDGIGATVSADVARKLARQHARSGIKGIKTGPRAAARANAYGLTPRELQIVALVAQGRSNQQIAQTLSRSARTVEHHVSALLGKLGVTHRGEVAGLAAVQGWWPAPAQAPASDVNQRPKSPRQN